MPIVVVMVASATVLVDSVVVIPVVVVVVDLVAVLSISSTLSPFFNSSTISLHHSFSILQLISQSEKPPQELMGSKKSLPISCVENDQPHRQQVVSVVVSYTNLVPFTD